MNAPTIPPDLTDDVAELDTIALQVRPVVDAGKARALAFEIVRVELHVLAPLVLTAATVIKATIFSRLFHALDSWLTAALDIDRGEVVQMHPGGPRLDLHDVQRIADLIASRAWSRAEKRPIPIESWIVFDIATALDRACQCDNIENRRIVDRENERLPSFADAYIRERLRADHDHTARTLLPLIIRDARRLTSAARVDGSAIEAAIAAHGGTPS